MRRSQLARVDSQRYPGIWAARVDSYCVVSTQVPGLIIIALCVVSTQVQGLIIYCVVSNRYRYICSVLDRYVRCKIVKLIYNNNLILT